MFEADVYEILNHHFLYSHYWACNYRYMNDLKYFILEFYKNQKRSSLKIYNISPLFLSSPQVPQI
jgi:hypothetical protein